VGHCVDLLDLHHPDRRPADDEHSLRLVQFVDGGPAGRQVDTGDAEQHLGAPLDLGHRGELVRLGDPDHGQLEGHVESRGEPVRMAGGHHQHVTADETHRESRRAARESLANGLAEHRQRRVDVHDGDDRLTWQGMLAHPQLGRRHGDRTPYPRGVRREHVDSDHEHDREQPAPGVRQPPAEGEVQDVSDEEQTEQRPGGDVAARRLVVHRPGCQR